MVIIGIPLNEPPLLVEKTPIGVSILNRVYHDTLDPEPASIIYRVCANYAGAQLILSMSSPPGLPPLGINYVIVVEEPEYDTLPPYVAVPDGADWAGLVLTGCRAGRGYRKVYVMRGGVIVAEWTIPAWVFDSPEIGVLLPITAFYLAYDDADDSIQPDPWLGEPYDTILVVMGARCGS